MSSFRGPGTQPNGEAAPRRNAPEEYFKSREVHRSDRGLILVDAFRFVNHPFYPQVRVNASSSPHTKTQPVMAEAICTQQRSPHRFFFLSHFHSDHYTGIQCSWHSDTIYCSRQTAALTQSELGVSSACLFPMDMNETYVFSLQTGTCLACVPETPLHPRVQAIVRGGCDTQATNLKNSNVEDVFAVRLIPANHCPGAAILLFDSPVFGTVVHTGDFRFNGSQQQWRERLQAPWRRTYISLRQLQAQARRSSSVAVTGVPLLPPYEQFIEDDVALREVAEKQALDVLFLDNTFCAPPYKFPTQWEATQNVIEVLLSLLCRAASRKKTADTAADVSQRVRVRCAVFVGCYTIGKERVALAIRDAFTPAPVEVCSGKAGSSADTSPDWRIYCSAHRHAMLTAMDFFPSCFQPLRPSATKAGGLSTDALPGGATHDTPFAEVKDTPVQLPELLHSEKAQRSWTAAQGTEPSEKPSCSAPSQPALSPAPEVRRSLTSDFSSQVSDTANTGPLDDSGPDYRLSVFLVPMSQVGYQSVAALVRDGDSAAVSLDDGVRINLAGYDSVLLVEPTGWCKKCSTRDVNERITLLKVPYSEHCGFHEMIKFVEFVNPAMVVPTVSEDGYKAHEALFVEKAPRLRSRVSNVQPITRFFSSVPLNSREAPRATEREVEATLRALEKPLPITSGTNTATSARLPVKQERTATGNAASLASRTSGQSAEASSSGSLVVVTATASATRQPRGDDKAAVRKRPHSSDDGNAPVEAAKTSTTAAHTLDRLFQRAKTAATHRSCQPAVRTVEGSDNGDDDDDCRIVRVVQNVVEISDDD